MTFPSPLLKTLEDFVLNVDVQHDESQREGAAIGEFNTQLLSEFLPWGEGGCIVLATTGVVELEYAALLKSIAIFDASCRGTIELTGKDRLECVNRLTTQQLQNLNAGDSSLAFVASRKGHVLADCIVHVLENKIIIDVDVTVVDQLCDHINSYIVMEDVQVSNETQSVHWIWCLGPDSGEMTSDVGHTFHLPQEFLGLNGFATLLSNDNVLPCWESLISQGARPIGWYALNMARVEQGVPVFMIDFDTHNLPHETSLIASRVRFDKGCYLGQEIVARMESLGQPKKRIMQLKMDSEDLPIAGTQIWHDELANGTPVGGVTSSAISPLRGGIPVVIAMIDKQHSIPDTTLYMYVGNELVRAVTEDLNPVPTNEST